MLGISEIPIGSGVLYEEIFKVRDRLDDIGVEVRVICGF